MIRQGDVLLLPVKEIPADSKLESVEGLRTSGERSGHCHELACDIYTSGDREFAVLAEEGTMTHQEHKHLKIPAGVYEIRIQREYVPIRRETPGRYD